MNYQRFIPLVTPIAVWLLSQAYLARPELFYIALAVGALLIIISVRQIAVPQKGNWLLYVIAPVLLFASLAAYAAIIISRFWIQMIFLATAWYIFSYLKDLYYYSRAAATEDEDRWSAQLENLLIAGGFLTVFSTTAFWFGLPAFVSWHPGLTLPVVAVVVLLLFMQFSLFSPNRNRPLGPTAFLIVMLLVESAWAFSLLPLNLNILAMFMAISYYFGFTVLRLKWSGSLNRRALQLPLALSFTAMLLLFITSRWL